MTFIGLFSLFCLLSNHSHVIASRVHAMAHVLSLTSAHCAVQEVREAPCIARSQAPLSIANRKPQVYHAILDLGLRCPNKITSPNFFYTEVSDLTPI